MKYKWDNENVREYARQEGVEEGIEIGIEKGIERGIEKGKYIEALKIANNLKRQGLSIEAIALATILTVKEIENL